MKTILLTFVSLISHPLLCQQYFLFDKKQVDEIDKIEAAFNSLKLDTKRIYVSEDFYPLAERHEVEFPISFLRTGDTLVNTCLVEYFYTAQDSKIRLIVYDWDETRKTDFIRERTNIMKTERLRFEDYNNKYDQLFEIISAKLGTPLKNNKIKDVVSTNSKYKERSTIWKKDDLNVEAQLLFTTSDNELGTFLVRVKMYWD